jgi:hypothetical protein
MFRRVRYIVIALACSVLMVASSQAAPTKALPRESALVLASVASFGEWLVSFVWEVPTVAPPLDITTAADGSALDPNGGQH